MELKSRMNMAKDSVLIWKMWPRDSLEIQCKRANGKEKAREKMSAMAERPRSSNWCTSGGEIGW